MTAPLIRSFLVTALISGFTPGGGIHAQGQPAPVMTLPALLALFQLPADAPDGTILGWQAGTGGDSRIRWAFEGIREAPDYQEREGFAYHRIGHLIVGQGGQPGYTMTYQGRQVPGVWRVTLLGPRAGPFQVSIMTEGDAAEMSLDLPAMLREAGWTVTPYRCRREDSPATFGTVVHRAEAPGRKPLWVQETWNFGHASGLTVAIHLLYFKDDADKAECIPR
jgi:hypothetical protein